MPGQGELFRKDCVFTVGRSHEKADWPYAHPGPDAWAGNREHSYSILFGVNDLPNTESCHLRFRLADAHECARERLVIRINGHEFMKTLPRGSGRAIYGDLSLGKKYEFSIGFPARLLNKGDNNISITNTGGSWFIYDWLGLETGGGIKLQPVRSSIFLGGIKSLPFILRQDNIQYQSTELSALNTGAATELTVKIAGLSPQVLQVAAGSQR